MEESTKWIEERRKYHRDYMATHPEQREKAHARQKRWREENKEHLKEYQKAYWERKAKEKAESIAQA